MLYSLKVCASSLNDSGELVILWHLDLLDVDKHKVTSLGDRVTQAQLIEVLGKRVPSLRVCLNLIREEVVLIGLFETSGDSLLERRVCAKDNSGRGLKRCECELRWADEPSCGKSLSVRYSAQQQPKTYRLANLSPQTTCRQIRQ